MKPEMEKAFTAWWEEVGTESTQETVIARSAYAEGASREREACFTIADSYEIGPCSCNYAGNVAEDIRARGEQ